MGLSRRRIPRSLLPLVLACSFGCGRGEVPGPTTALRLISGRVTSGGKPAAGVEVRLYPLNRAGDSSAPTPFGTTDKDGRFTLRTGDAEGAPEGAYQAGLTWPTAVGKPDRLGGTFEDPQGSGLVVEIGVSTTEIPTFEIGTGPARKSR